jgi:uncharacterized integral membrane protein
MIREDCQIYNIQWFEETSPFKSVQRTRYPQHTSHKGNGTLLTRRNRMKSCVVVVVVVLLLLLLLLLFILFALFVPMLFLFPYIVL